MTSVPAGDLQTHVKPLASQGRGYVGQILLTLLYTITLDINYDGQIQLEQLMKWPQLTSKNLGHFLVTCKSAPSSCKCPNLLDTFWTSFQTFWTHFGQVSKDFGRISDKHLMFRHFLVAFWTSVQSFWSHFGHLSNVWALFGHSLDRRPQFGHLLGTFWSHFGHILSKMCPYSHRSPAPKISLHFSYFINVA